MRLFIILLLASASLYAVPFKSGEIFPPDPMRSLEEMKMKPMVSHYLYVSSSGSHTITSSVTAEHGNHVGHYMSLLDDYWINQWEVSETYKMKDYKYR